MNYLIIGAGVAGLAAAETLRQVDPCGQVTILCQERTPPYSRVLLPYLLAGEVADEGIYLEVPKGVELLTGKEVIRVDPRRRELVVSAGKVFPFDKLLIASGASPVRPQIKGADLPFVFTVRELTDIQGMRERVRRGKRAVIAGGGLVSMMVGEALHKLGMKVTFVVSSNRVLSRILDLPASKLVTRVLAENGLEVITGEDIVEIERGEVGGGLKFRHSRLVQDADTALVNYHRCRSINPLLRSGGSRECDLVVFGKGVRPNVGFLKGSGIEIRRGIIVDEHQETNVKGIYAAGDVAQTMDIVYGDRRVNAFWPTAVEQGRIAALNMASQAAVYEGKVARNTLEVFGLPIFTVGMGREDGPQVLREEGGDFYHKLVLDDGMLKGVIFVGEMENEGFYLFLIKNRVDVSPFATALLRNTFGYPHYLCSVALKRDSWLASS